MTNTETTLGLAFKAALQNISKKKQVQLVADLLYHQYAVLRSFRPLALGIDQAIRSAHPEFDPALIARVLSYHCRRTRYLKAIAKGGKRYQLDDKSQGVVTPEEQAIAKNYTALRLTTPTKSASPANKTRQSA